MPASNLEGGDLPKGMSKLLCLSAGPGDLPQCKRHRCRSETNVRADDRHSGQIVS